MKFENKRAIITILKTNVSPEYSDRKILRSIKDWKAAHSLSQTESEKEDARRHIRHYRELLKRLHTKTYIVNIYIKKYHATAERMAFARDLNDSSKDAFKTFLNEAINEAIRTLRERMKRSSKPARFFTVLVEKQGQVFLEEGSILKAHVKKNINVLYDGKTPVSNKKYIGIEIEFCARIKEEQLAIKIFQKGLHKFVQLKQDGSLRPQEKEIAYEFAILLEETTYKKDLKKVTDLLQEIKAAAKDRRCGLHVHFDMRQRNKELVYNNLVACQYALLSVVDPSRYNNEFCEVVRNRKFPTKFTGERHERYKTINAAAYYKYKTLEIRMHEGSVNYEEISHWIDLLMKVVNYPRKLKNNVTELSVLQKRLKFKQKLFKYAVDRCCTWQVQNSDLTRQLRHDIEGLRTRVSDSRLNRILPVDGHAPLFNIPAPSLGNPFLDILEENELDLARSVAQTRS
jgi:hypothetical protein